MNKMATFQPLKKMIFNKKIVKHLTFSRKLSNKLLENTIEHEENFTERIEKRRKEARKTISVEVNGKKDRESVEKACSEAGIVASMRRYTTQSERNFYLVEFTEEEMVKELMLHKAVLPESKFAIRSPFLTLQKGLRQEPKLNKYWHIRVEESRKRLETELNNCTDISHQIEVYFNRIRASETDIRLKYLTCRQVELPFSGLFPFFSLLPFGSSVNGFGNKSSNLDVVISLEGLQESCLSSDLHFQNRNGNTYRRMENNSSVIPYLKLIMKFLYMTPGIPKERDIQCVDTARIPFIKYINTYTGLDCEMSINNWSDFYMSEMLYNYTRVEPRLAPLALFVRLWARHHALTNKDPGRWITNFSLDMMVLHYMMARQGLVPLDVLQFNAREEDARTMENGRDCSFLRDVHQVRRLQRAAGDATLGQLFRGFLEHYAAFDFRRLRLSPRMGLALPKNVNNPLHIENPLQPALNVTHNVTMEVTSMLIRACQKTRLTGQGEEEVWGIAKFLPPIGSGGR